MSRRHAILGFDAREMWLTPAGDAHRSGGWTEENKKTWLLRDDVDRPLSVDDSVWLSVFHADPQLQLPETSVGIVQNLWSDLKALKTNLDSQWNSLWRRCWLIAVIVYIDDIGCCDHAHWKSELGSAAPSTCAPQWQCLGYDVADAWLLSGLSNCTHISEPDFPSLRTKFRPRINQYHLFDDKEDAMCFRDESNKRCPDHAPFFIYRLHRIEPG